MTAAPAALGLSRLVRQSRRAAALRLLGEAAAPQSRIDRRFRSSADDHALRGDLCAWREGDGAAQLRFGFRLGTRLRLEARGRGPAEIAPADSADCQASLQTEPDAKTRRLHLQQQCIAAAPPPGLLRDRRAADRIARAVSGLDYVDLVMAQIGLRGRVLRRAARAFLDQTRASHLAERRRWWPTGGEDPVPAADLAYLICRSGPVAANAQLPLDAVAERLLEAARAFGCVTTGLRLDIAERRGKSPRAFAAPVDPPHDILVGVRPSGSIRDVSILLHELGHGLAFANVAPGLRWEFRLLWHDPMQETFAFLMSTLLQEAESVRWLLDAPPAEAAAIAAYARFCEVHLMRRHAALALLALDRADTRVDFPQRFRRAMERETAIEHLPQLAHGSVEPEIGSCSYFAAWLGSAAILRRLAEDFGRAWWQSPSAWRRLRGQWRDGGGSPSGAVASPRGRDASLDALIARALAPA